MAAAGATATTQHALEPSPLAAGLAADGRGAAASPAGPAALSFATPPKGDLLNDGTPMAAAAAAGASPLAGSPLAGPLQFAAGDGAAMAQRTAAVKDRSSRRDLQAAAFGAVPRTGSHGHLAGLARRSVGPGDVAGEEAEAARRKERAEAAATAAQEHRDEKLAAARNKRLASSEDAEVGSTCGCRPAGCVQGCCLPSVGSMLWLVSRGNSSQPSHPASQPWPSSTCNSTFNSLSAVLLSLLCSQEALIDVPDNILRLPSFLRTTTAEREGLAALAAQAGGPSALMRSITAEMQVGASAGGLSAGTGGLSAGIGACLFAAAGCDAPAAAQAGGACWFCGPHGAPPFHWHCLNPHSAPGPTLLPCRSPLTAAHCPAARPPTGPGCDAGAHPHHHSGHAVCGGAAGGGGAPAQAHEHRWVAGDGHVLVRNAARQHTRLHKAACSCLGRCAQLPACLPACWPLPAHPCPRAACHGQHSANLHPLFLADEVDAVAAVTAYAKELDVMPTIQGSSELEADTGAWLAGWGWCGWCWVSAHAC